MDLFTELQTTTTRSRRAERHHNSSSQSTPPTYGYHNTFHTHATPVLSSPPSYACATSIETLSWLQSKAQAERAAVRQFPEPPPYTCTVELEGVMGMKSELTCVFLLERNRNWNDVYVILRGTQLNIHRVKIPGILSKNRKPLPGRLIKTYSLQHAEVGVASDFKKGHLTPKSPFAHLIPVASRAKLFETDPHLFEPPREHVLRLRLEADQFLLCANSQEEMLSWSENLCAGIDISPPLEDRCEPRYRSLPRRSRRQRVLDGAHLGDNFDNLSSLEAGRRFIAEQEEIIRQLYPNLANGGRQNTQESSMPSTQGGDPDRDEFDADDVRFPTHSSPASRAVSRNGEGAEDSRPSSSESRYSDPKATPILRPSEAQALRYRRRCAPILLACSPRVSDVVFGNGKRLRINTKETILVGYTLHPPRYDAHRFPKIKRTPKPIEIAPQNDCSKAPPTNSNVERPASPLRGVSDDSINSFGCHLASASSDPGSELVRSAAPSEPPSPTAATQAKSDAARQLTTMGKGRSSEEQQDDTITMTLGVPLII
ncbi:hypothetical protein CC80DRAFT_16342 [Byssothecium circinans]|uniref:PH domain-containing protein n=1 Tax=Byssothecium circinans TaxID=147558 RepID=A0A6A5U1W5_9PLEO|nr:hypothetical protein CC80DRAFT_16342 [Byssothecium circinans]